MKRVWARVLATVMATTMLIGSTGLMAEAKSKKTKRETQAIAATVSQEDALATAYADAGVKAEDATLTKSKLDYDDGMPEYEFTFYAGGYKYEYDVDATTGVITEREKKYSTKYASGTGTGNGTGNSSGALVPSTPTTTLSAQDALNIALKDAGFAESDVYVKKTKLKTKKTYSYYDIEFYAGYLEYEYEIDAASGTILEKEIDD